MNTFAHNHVLALSPTLTASSSSTAAVSSQERTSSKQSFDTDMDFAAPPDFSEMFDFDGFDSASTAHSPSTLSPNRTPSPLVMTGASPFALPASFDFSTLPSMEMDHDEMDFSFDYPTIEKSLPIPEINIKQEPTEFSFPITTQPVATPQSSTLPEDQQQALQQLLSNILNYQSQYGVENSMPVGGTSAAAGPSGTVEPSMLFGRPPSDIPTVSAASSYVSPSLSLPSLAHQPSPISEESSRPRKHSLDVQSDDELVCITPPDDPSKPNPNVDVDAAIQRLIPLPDIFSAGRGKGGKKGGGLSSVVRGDDEDLDDDDSWRPSPEEYKKLSSKEKRQLRNKLSARAFRTRRKDYIGTLEGHIKDRDGVIDAMKAELTNNRSENHDLRRELAALKASTMTVLHPATASIQSQSPALITALAMSTPHASLGPVKPEVKRTNTPISINTRKDIPASPAVASRGFWGGNNDPLSGGPTICYTMFTPDLVLPSTSPSNGSAALPELPRFNLNPRLNDVQPNAIAGIPSHLGNTANGRDLTDGFSEWSEANPFSLRSMDSYRIQMWSRLAREAAAEKSGLQSDLRPKFFSEPTTVPAPSTSAQTSTPQPSSPTSVSAQLASTATSHITSRLANSFWSAFSGPSAKLDTDKLTAVVLGTAKLRVVDVKTGHGSVNHTGMEDEDLALAAALGGLRLQAGLGSSRDGYGYRARENPLGAISSFFKHAGGCPTRA